MDERQFIMVDLNADKLIAGADKWIRLYIESQWGSNFEVFINHWGSEAEPFIAVCDDEQHFCIDHYNELASFIASYEKA